MLQSPEKGAFLLRMTWSRRTCRSPTYLSKLVDQARYAAHTLIWTIYSRRYVHRDQLQDTGIATCHSYRIQDLVSYPPHNLQVLEGRICGDRGVCRDTVPLLRDAVGVNTRHARTCSLAGVQVNQHQLFLQARCDLSCAQVTWDSLRSRKLGTLSVRQEAEG